jgi:hypothetical protein
MSREHLNTPPVTQGDDRNGCWAASFSWWLRAVLRRDYSFEDVLAMYNRWTVDIDNVESESYGALNEWGVRLMFNDTRFPVVGMPAMSSDLRVDQVAGLLERSPVLIAYYEPDVSGYHMNVLVTVKNTSAATAGILVMDPAFTEFQDRKLDYYKRYTKPLYLGYRMGYSPETSYGYETNN